MDGVELDLASEASTAASAQALEAALRADPLKPEVGVRPMYDPARSCTR